MRGNGRAPCHSAPMKQHVPVDKIMSAHPVTLHPGDPISRIRKTFIDNGVHHLPVTDGGKLIGIVSWTDLMRVSFGDAFGQDEALVDATLDHTVKLEDLMNAKPVTIASGAPIREAAEILANAAFHALPVVDGEKLAGIVTSQDLIRYLCDQY